MSGTIPFLTNEERDRFALWLEHEASSDDVLAKQMDAIHGMEALVKKMRTEAIAATIIAKKLRSIEDQTI